MLSGLRTNNFPFELDYPKSYVINNIGDFRKKTLDFNIVFKRNNLSKILLNTSIRVPKNVTDKFSLLNIWTGQD